MEHTYLSDAYVIEGKLALPYTYFAGRTGSYFITQIRDKQLINAVKCHTCGKVFLPPRQTCEICMEDLSQQWVTVSNKGIVVNHTIIHHEDKHHPRKPPFVLAMILLDGADTPMIHILEELDHAPVKKGMAVEAVFSQETTNTLLDIDHFKPVKEAP